MLKESSTKLRSPKARIAGSADQGVAAAPGIAIHDQGIAEEVIVSIIAEKGVVAAAGVIRNPKPVAEKKVASSTAAQVVIAAASELGQASDKVLLTMRRYAAVAKQVVRFHATFQNFVAAVLAL